MYAYVYVCIYCDVNKQQFSIKLIILIYYINIYVLYILIIFNCITSTKYTISMFI